MAFKINYRIFDLFCLSLNVVVIENEIIKGRIFVAQITEDDIFHLNYAPNQISTGDDFKEGHDAYQKLRHGQKFKVIIENGKFTGIDKTATDYLKNNREASIKGIKYGQEGEITVNGKTYNGYMAPLGLSDAFVLENVRYELLIVALFIILFFTLNFSEPI